MNEPEKQHEVDEFHGMGGSYVLNPETGKRDLVERTKEAEAVPPSDAGSAGEESVGKAHQE